MFSKWTSPRNSMTIFAYLLVERTGRDNAPNDKGFGFDDIG